MLFNMILPGAVETARLPKEYQEVEYIQSSGTQYIDTGFVPNNNTRVVMDLTVLNGTVSSFFGARKGGKDSSFTAFCLGTTSLRSDYGSSQLSLSISGIGSRVIVDADKNTFKYGSYSVTHSAATFNSTYSLYLLQNNYIGAADENSCMAATLYSVQIYDNGTLVRDLVPCYRKADSAKGLYDLISKAFYANAGTGAFAAGPDVNNSPSTGETVEFTYSGNYTDNRINGKGTVRLNTSGTLNVTGGTVTVAVYIQGAGGGAAVGTYGGTLYCASGGGGGYQTITETLSPGTYDIVIGSGGEKASGAWTSEQAAGKGGDTIAFGATSTGGNGGYSYKEVNIVGGTGGTPNGENGNTKSGSSPTIDGGSPNGGGVVNGAPENGGDGYVELTFR